MDCPECSKTWGRGYQELELDVINDKLYAYCAHCDTSWEIPIAFVNRGYHRLRGGVRLNAQDR